LEPEEPQVWTDKLDLTEPTAKLEIPVSLAVQELRDTLVQLVDQEHKDVKVSEVPVENVELQEVLEELD